MFLKNALFCLLSLILISGLVYSQKEHNIWYFGIRAGINFNSGFAVFDPNSAMHAIEGCETLCDKDGKLLFYTNGDTVWGGDHKPLPNGTGLNGSKSATQSTRIIKQPGSCSLYYLFTLDEYCKSLGLQYSVIDLSLNGGLGDIIPAKKNLLLHTPSAEKIAVTRHSNKKDYWIITFNCASDSFYTYLLTGAGLNTTPVCSYLGLIPQFGAGSSGVGQLKISEDGKRVVFAEQHLTFHLFDFDNTTGMLSNRIDPSVPELGCYGVEFSPNSQLLYINTNDGTSPSKLYQFDISGATSGVINATRKTIYTASSTTDDFASLQLAPDGKIYHARVKRPVSGGYAGQQYLGVVQNPDVAGMGCNYQHSGFDLTGPFSLFGLPSYSKNIFDTTSNGLSATIVHTDATCKNPKGSAIITPYGCSQGYTFNWQPGGMTDSVITGLLPGTYTVTVKDSANNVYVDSVVIKNFSIPEIDSIAPLFMCKGDTVILTATSGGGTAPYQYSWNNGTYVGQSVAVSPADTLQYTVVVVDSLGCSDSASTLVYVVPNIKATIISDTIICKGESVQLWANGGTQYSWSPSTSLNSDSISAPVATPDTSTIFRAIVSSGTCAPDTAYVNVKVTSPPVFSITGNTLLCPGQSTTITLSGAGSYLWGNGSNSTSLVLSPAKDTLLKAKASNGGCWAHDSVKITVYKPMPVDAGLDKTITAGDTVQLNASGGISYSWSPADGLSCIDCPSPLAFPLATTTYKLTNTDQYGCVSTDFVTVFVHTDCDNAVPFLPSAFSPNNDGMNDNLELRIPNLECIVKYHLTIFNRWGEKVFDSIDPMEKWNGTYHGLPCDAATFNFILDAELANGKLFSNKGTVSLVK